MTENFKSALLTAEKSLLKYFVYKKYITAYANSAKMSMSIAGVVTVIMIVLLYHQKRKEVNHANNIS